MTDANGAVANDVGPKKTKEDKQKDKKLKKKARAKVCVGGACDRSATYHH
jgi:hypothetical protein